MGRKIIFLIFFSSIIFSQSMWDRLRVPIIFKGKMSLGYDNNFLRLSETEIQKLIVESGIIQESNAKNIGLSSTLDSPIIKPSIKIIYSPIIFDSNVTNFVTSFSYSYFIKSENKSYLISSFSTEIKLHSYSWIKFGVRYLPKYYIRNYVDVETEPGKWVVNDYYDRFNDDFGVLLSGCYFFSQKYYFSYSKPINWIRRTWMQIYLDQTNEYFESNFTEFDLDKKSIQLDFNHRFRKKHRIRMSISHGKAINISHGSDLSSTLIDRSYVFEKIRSEFIFIPKRKKLFNSIIFSLQLEQRYYSNIYNSNQLINSNWKYYLDGRSKVRFSWNLFENLGVSTWYQFRWRNAHSPLYGNFEWIEGAKSYSKHELWLEFSYDFATDILY